MTARYIILCLFGILLLPLQAQELPASLLLTNQTVLKGSVFPRKAGTTQIRFKEENKEAVRNLSTAEIEKIRFDLTAFRPGNLQVYFKAAQYENVIKELKGGIIPYFSFVDLDTNSNELIKLFIHSLYLTENYPGISAASKEVAKFQVNGDMRKMADIFLALSLLDQGELDKFSKYESYFNEVERTDPMAPAVWLGQAKLAKLKDRRDEEIPALAKIITEVPMQTEWSAEALYLSAVYHQTRTNLVVANQICQEIQIIAPLTEWPELSEDLQEKIKSQASELEIELVEFGDFRKNEIEQGEAKVDYRDRQRALEEQEVEFTE